MPTVVHADLATTRYVDMLVDTSSRIGLRVDSIEDKLNDFQNGLEEKILRDVAAKLRKLAVENDLAGMSDEEFEQSLMKILGYEEG